MSQRIYKYAGPENIDKIFTSHGKFTLKCSEPKDFNDPYELFLTTDFNIDAGSLATYVEAIGELPQLPTTCFSASPVVIPMWAHYAQNHEGFTIELSRAQLAQDLKDFVIDSVRYSDKPLHDLSDLLARVRHLAKPRYTYMLHRAVFNAAYFTKLSCWNYEQEIRLVVQKSCVRELGNMMLLDFSTDAITSIVCGAKASSSTKAKLQQISASLNCRYFELRVGKSSAVPFLIDPRSRSFIFNGAEISSSTSYCQECCEPLVSSGQKCSWCQIDDEMRAYSASRNPYRMLDEFGALEEYIRKMDEVRASGNRRGDADT
jgi:hypothetical protein